MVSRIKNSNVYLTKDVVGSGSTIVGDVHFDRYTPTLQTANQKLTIQETFSETSEVSTTLLGVNRAETQLSLFQTYLHMVLIKIILNFSHLMMEMILDHGQIDQIKFRGIDIMPDDLKRLLSQQLN